MGLKPGMKGLDTGCGVGRPLRDIVRFADVHVTGGSINRLHVERAMEYAEYYGLANKLRYIEGDFMVRRLHHAGCVSCIMAVLAM